MEATLFSGWIYDALKPFAAELEMGHPAMMKAIGAAKKKNDKLDARKIADLVRCNLLPACYVAPPEIRDLRRLLRYRNSGGGAGGADEEQDERAADGSGRGVQQTAAAREEVFHANCWTQLEEVPESVKDLLRLSRGALEMFETTQRQLLDRLQKDPLLAKRVELLQSIGGVGEVTALTWALEVCDPRRFSSIGGCGELLRADVGAGFVGRQTAAGADLQAAQCASANGADRGGETGAAVESAIGGAARAGIEARQSQPGDPGGGAEAGGVSVGGGQIGQAVRGSQAARRRKRRSRESGLKTSSELTSGKGDFPARAARREGSDARTVLAVKGSLRRAKTGAPLTAPGRSAGSTDATGGSGGKITKTRQCVATQRLISDSPAVPRLVGAARRRSSS